MHTFEDHLRWLPLHSSYLQWFEGKGADSKRTLSFFDPNFLDRVRYLFRYIAYQDDLVYVPRCEFDPTGERIYVEMRTADWWWDVQVQRPNLRSGNVS